jgi:hypothetical protein
MEATPGIENREIHPPSPRLTSNFPLEIRKHQSDALLAASVLHVPTKPVPNSYHLDIHSRDSLAGERHVRAIPFAPRPQRACRVRAVILSAP